jgi:hypothetical protein
LGCGKTKLRRIYLIAGSKVHLREKIRPCLKLNSQPMLGQLNMADEAPTAVRLPGIGLWFIAGGRLFSVCVLCRSGIFFRRPRRRKANPPPTLEAKGQDPTGPCHVGTSCKARRSRSFIFTFYRLLGSVPLKKKTNRQAR